MIPRDTIRAAALTLTIAAASVGILRANPATTSPQSANSLEAFERVVGGAWTSEGSAATFEWSFGHRSVIAKSYTVAADGSRNLVGQGFFYWDPEAAAIKSVSVAEGMPFEVLEMTSRFEDNVLVNEIRTIASDGSIGAYVETWEFTDSDTYAWTLYEGDLGSAVWMTDTYHRR